MSLEQDIATAVKESMGKAIESTLGGYNTPLAALIKEVVERRKDEVKELLESSMDSAFKGDFREAIKDAVTHKLSRILVSKMEGEIEKQANELRSSPEFRAKLTLAIGQVIREFKA